MKGMRPSCTPLATRSHTPGTPWRSFSAASSRFDVFSSRSIFTATYGEPEGFAPEPADSSSARNTSANCPVPIGRSPVTRNRVMSRSPARRIGGGIANERRGGERRARK